MNFFLFFMLLLLIFHHPGKILQLNSFDFSQFYLHILCLQMALKYFNLFFFYFMLLFFLFVAAACTAFTSWKLLNACVTFFFIHKMHFSFFLHCSAFCRFLFFFCAVFSQRFSTLFVDFPRTE